MGRGRAKAKQTKVARQLKYSSGGTDLSRLADELASQSDQQPPNREPFEGEDEDDDPYARYAERYNTEDDGEEGHSSNQRRRA
ncbi:MULTISPECIES: DUF3073 domain-containing protein [unclassified Streptomyces]|uniref:DUF3073 domain-containing protein n=1 Tax=unclassified Streptomyces TaxID=2593676 RepID=UPI000C27A3F6|nr:DUF3073 domain-containing protein [Streptomyces sp. CB02959]PJN41324.1 hypothetical protein CG747_05815 [Streptomyces sp. CB02959]